MNPRLIIFDVDGTIAARDTGEFLSGVEQYLSLIGKARNVPAIALATNQGGVGLRYWMESAGFGNPANFPTKESIDKKLNTIAARIENLIDCPVAVYVCYRYQSKKSYKFSPIPDHATNNNFWRSDWRKPAPGMLVQAMADAHVSPAETLMIGDRPEDREAATAAGCSFQWAQKFFARGWKEGENYGLLR